MNRKSTMRILRHSFKVAGADKVLIAYFIFFIIVSVILTFIEPAIATLGDSLWYSFAVATTVGFGDIAAMSPAGRVLTVILSLYSVVVLAIFTAVITTFFLDIAKARANKSANEFMDELERLPELSKEELENLSKRIKYFLASDDE